MKKFIIPVITLILITAFIFVIISFNTTKEITSTTEIEAIRLNSSLDILVNLGDFSKENYSERKLLDISMQYAAKLNLMNEINTDELYLQYVNKDDLHKLINELTGLSIEAPIEIEDFYYLYDSENSYYYYLGASPMYYNVSNINKIQRNGDKYIINCSIQKNEDGELIKKDNVSIILNYLPENSTIKYQVEQIIVK